MTDTASMSRQGVADPVRALADYRRGDFLFATQQRTLFARGVEQEIPFTGESWCPGDLDNAATPLAVGVLPFDLSVGPAPRLVVPREWRVAGPAHGPIRALPAREVGVPERLLAVPEQDKHVAAVVRALEPLRDGALRKVVLARVLDIAFATDVDPANVLHNLIADNPDGFTYAAALPGERTLVGASPELLVRRYGTRVVAHPHAGTAPRSPDPDVDQANARKLLASAKDKTEHALVVEAVVEALRPLCRTLDVPAEPSLAPTPAVWHLGTEITGELADPDASALRLATALHPTPAVCGTPTDAARDLVRELEPFDRDYYAGAVGWVDAAGDGEWAVAIRCAEIADQSMRLYAGGGIVAASDPDAELRETSAKFATLLQAMGVDPEP